MLVLELEASEKKHKVPHSHQRSEPHIKRCSKHPWVYPETQPQSRTNSSLQSKVKQIPHQ